MSKRHRCLTSKQVSYQNKTLKYLSNIKAFLTCHCLTLSYCMICKTILDNHHMILFHLQLHCGLHNYTKYLTILYSTNSFHWPLSVQCGGKLCYRQNLIMKCKQSSIWSRTTLSCRVSMKQLTRIVANKLKHSHLSRTVRLCMYVAAFSCIHQLS